VAELHRGRRHNRLVQRVVSAGLPSQDLVGAAGAGEMDEAAAGLGTMAKMDVPLLMPSRDQRRARHGAERPDDIRGAEGGERLLILLPDIGTVGIRAQTRFLHDQMRHQIGLNQLVRIRIAAQAPPIPQVAANVIQLQLLVRKTAVLDPIPIRFVGQIVDAGSGGREPLIERLRPHLRRMQEELRDIGPPGFSGEESPAAFPKAASE